MVCMTHSCDGNYRTAYVNPQMMLYTVAVGILPISFTGERGKMHILGSVYF